MLAAYYGNRQTSQQILTGSPIPAQIGTSLIIVYSASEKKSMPQI